MSVALPLRYGASGARLLGVGDHRPAGVLTNEHLAGLVDTSDTWIRERTGIVTRRIASGDETVVTMGASAGAKALAAAGLDPADVDLVLLASCTMPTPLPGGAASIAHALGIPRAGATDLNAACAGFCYALGWAADAVRGGSARHVLVVGSERLSSWLDWGDRATCVIFGDGAGAVVVGAAPTNGIGPVVWGSDGSRHTAIEVPEDSPYVRMDGPAVYRWATTEMTRVCRDACAAAGVAPADLGAFVPHQANLRIIDSLARALGVPEDRVARDIADMGNTSSASVPLALARIRDEGRVEPGEPVLLVGFGAGLTYAGQVVCAP